MRIERSAVRARTARLVAATLSGCAFAYAMLAAQAAPVQEVDARQLSAVSAAVERSGVGGIAWYVDAGSNRVVVTADRTVSTAEVASIKRSAGAGAIQVNRTTGVFSPLLAAGDAIYGGQYRCSPDSTSCRAAPTTCSRPDTAGSWPRRGTPTPATRP